MLHLKVFPLDRLPRQNTNSHLQTLPEQSQTSQQKKKNHAQRKSTQEDTSRCVSMNPGTSCCEVTVKHSISDFKCTVMVTRRWKIIQSKYLWNILGKNKQTNKQKNLTLSSSSFTLFSVCFMSLFALMTLKTGVKGGRTITVQCVQTEQLHLMDFAVLWWVATSCKVHYPQLLWQNENVKDWKLFMRYWIIYLKNYI